MSCMWLWERLKYHGPFLSENLSQDRWAPVTLVESDVAAACCSSVCPSLTYESGKRPRTLSVSGAQAPAS